VGNCAGDVLFFDGSHRCLQNSDVTAFFLDVLPELPSGVIVGIHDIVLPNDYPSVWKDRYYSEQYILAAYLLGAQERVSISWAAGYVVRTHKQELFDKFPVAISERWMKEKQFVGGGCFFFTSP
jgi:hypothetical protein